jgi:acetyl esterase/lipase
MTPIATPAQADAIVLGTGPLPGATASESWHRQYGSAFARNVTVATLTPYLADPAKATGAAVIVAPGGGFRTLSMENEGSEVAQALAARGVSAFVLKYRLNQTRASWPSSRDRAVRPRHHGRRRTRRRRPSRRRSPTRAPPLRSFGRAARRWRVDADRIGMVGFSAGAMLTMATALAGATRSRPSRRHLRAARAGDGAADAPPLFVALAVDDPLFANSGFGLDRKLAAAKRPVEFHYLRAGRARLRDVPEGDHQHRLVRRVRALARDARHAGPAH